MSNDFHRAYEEPEGSPHDDHDSLKAYICTNLLRIQSPSDVADGVNASYHTLRKDFRRREGCTLGQYIRTRRVEQAKALLAHTSLPCFAVCYEVGFKREEVGARVFKAVTGRTMLEYRELVRRTVPVM